MSNRQNQICKPLQTSRKAAAISIHALLDPYGSNLAEPWRTKAILAFDGIARGLTHWHHWDDPVIDQNMRRLRNARASIGKTEFGKYQRKFWRRFLS